METDQERQQTLRFPAFAKPPAIYRYLREATAGVDVLLPFEIASVNASMGRKAGILRAAGTGGIADIQAQTWVRVALVSGTTVDVCSL
jgi:hypothetical protein